MGIGAGKLIKTRICTNRYKSSLVTSPAKIHFWSIKRKLPAKSFYLFIEDLIFGEIDVGIVMS